VRYILGANTKKVAELKKKLSRYAEKFAELPKQHRQAANKR